MIDFKTIRNYKEMIYSEKRNLLIIQCCFPKQNIYFLTLNEENKQLNLIFIKLITFENTDIIFSSEPWNSCLIKDKLLLIGTKIGKYFLDEVKTTKNNNNNHNHKDNNNIILAKKNKRNKIVAGFYSIDIDNYEYIYQEINNSKNVFYITKVNENMFICSIDFMKEQYLHDNYGLISYIISEKKGKITIDKKSSKKGDYKNINNREMIDDFFIVCSCNENNHILKIDEKGKIIFFFNLNLKIPNNF